MIYRLILAHILILSIVLGSTPAKPGVIPSEKVKRQIEIMSESYTQGGLAAKMQRVKAANLEAAANGTRDLREDVYGSFPVILGSYSDSDDNQNVVGQLQQELFDGPWPTITMTEHYEQMSYGQYHLSGTVYGWYELSHESEYYEGSQTSPYDNGFYGPPGGVGDFMTESLNQADPEIDFTQYDNDGPDGIPNSGDDDGKVDATFFVHSGRGGESGGPSIWSHRWRYSSAIGSGQGYVTNDIGFNGQAIRVQDYIMQPAVAGGSQGSGGLIEIGVFSHEFGHALGLPDLYDTDYSSDGVGSWCLMASGSWSSASSPVHLSVWCKEMLGWTIPIMPNQNIVNFEFPNAEENSFAVKLWTHGELDPFVGNYSHGQDVGQEYYLIENRQRLGSEQGLPGTGLVIWHIDNSRTTNSNENHRMVDVKAADGHFNGSNSGDSWPGSTDNRNFDFETIPTSIGWGGVNTEVAVLNISDSDTTMWADIEVLESNPHLRIIDMLVSDFNGDNIFAPGENVMIWLIVENTGAMANNTSATLSIDGNAVELIDDVIGFNPIDFMATSTSNQAFAFNISDTLSPGPVNFEVRFTSDEMTEPDLQHFELLLGLPEIVLMDNDGALSGASNYQTYFTDALEAAELVHVVWDLEERTLPDLDWLDDFPSVIWFSGDNPAPLSGNSTLLIADYLDGGGNILMTGQNMASGDLTVENLLIDYFAVDLIADDITTPNVYGDPGHEFFDINDRFAIGSSDAANNQITSDSYNILQGGSSIFMYPFLGGASAGSSVKNETYSAVMLGFGLEALTHFSSETDHSRGEVIERLLDWMHSPSTSSIEYSLLVPETSGISSSYPNPFNPAIQFDINVSTGEMGFLQIMNIRGGLVESMEVQQSGSISWKPSGSLAGGVYFARFLVNGKRVGTLEKITYLK
ncbi:MAG: M6 family metalloprotease domain-containing protein [Candidatus Marinimicrobia bacterium]|nr:M6 family metalloprotease domain-containing protein [Candidatus Neomarinimicrobiota bacterium]MBL7120837.1 M6 family metalloprotease domain-containing protein [Candidatus Neomarinimicrobiota bacterium]